MNKPIINGIDVSECSFYNNGKCNNPNGMACNCTNNAVCYFKELKRLQQENEKLRDVASDVIIEQERLIAKVNELRESLEEIRNHCVNYARTESYVIDETFNDFLGIIFSKINEVLK